jgi:hypothetical protein
MMEDDRLRLLPADLAGLLAQHGPAPTQLAACRLAATAVDLDDDRAAQALEALSSAGPDRTSADVSQQLADEYDEAAWDAQDRGSDAEYESSFRRARAAAALAFAHRQDASDAVYEAAHAFGDAELFAVALRAALSM